MSGMFDAKRDKMQRKEERTLKEQKARKKTKIITIAVTVTFLVLLAAALLLNSNMLRRSVSVVTIDGIDFSAAEFEYFYNTAYIDYMNYMSQYEGMDDWLPNTNMPLSEQLYDETTGETWADIFVASAYSTLKRLVGLYNAAQADGFLLTQEHVDSIDNEITSIESEAVMYGMSAELLLQNMYGAAINMKTFREVFEFITISERFAEHTRTSFEYSQTQINDYYSENADALDVFTYRILNVNADTPDAEAEDYDALLEEAVAAARELAGTYAEAITDVDSFMEAAIEYNEGLYSDPDFTLWEMQGESLTADYSSWLQDGERAYGDTTVVNTDQGAAVVLFVSREDNSYRTVGMRQILILRESVSADDFEEGESDPLYLEALAQAEEDASVRANEVYELFIDAGGTETAIIDLVEEHSDDTTEGGYYDGISKYSYQGADFYNMKVVPELEEWLFDEERAAGDYELIPSSAYGFHLIYFTGFGERFSDTMAEDRMRTNAYNEWMDSIVSSVGEPVEHGAFIFVNI